MGTTMFKACRLFWQVERVEVERKTAKHVIINGRRRAMVTDWECYYDTFQEAKDHLIERALRDLEVTEKALTRCHAQLAKAKDLQEIHLDQ